MTMRLIFLLLMTVLMTLPAQAKPLLKLGSQGVDVLEAQALLQLLGYYDGDLDGTYTESTEKSVNAFQKVAGLTPDGILGQSTWNKLLPNPTQPAEPKKSSPQAPTAKSPAKSAEVTNTPILRRGAKGDAVYRLQKRLVNLGFLGIAPDGDFGELTEKAVKAAQQKYKIEADGVVGGATWSAIGL
jgi:N-acetylmuramoyl-L-alanine amidase